VIPHTHTYIAADTGLLCAACRESIKPGTLVADVGGGPVHYRCRWIALTLHLASTGGER
jgi:hypothetical protein